MTNREKMKAYRAEMKRIRAIQQDTTEVLNIQVSKGFTDLLIKRFGDATHVWVQHVDSVHGAGDFTIMHIGQLHNYVDILTEETTLGDLLYKWISGQITGKEIMAIDWQMYTL